VTEPAILQICYNTPMTIDSAAQTLYSYHHLNQTLKKADAILMLGSNDVRVAEYASDLFLQGYAPLLIFSGGKGRMTSDSFTESEADTYAKVAISRGVPAESIITENKSTNTGENISFTQKILKEKGIVIHSFILVQKPYMERRVYATSKKNIPEIECVITSPNIPYEEYPNEAISKEMFLNAMVADMQRILIYPEKGFQIPQEVPESVMQAYVYLVEQGFSKQLL